MQRRDVALEVGEEQEEQQAQEPLCALPPVEEDLPEEDRLALLSPEEMAREEEEDACWSAQFRDQVQQVLDSLARRAQFAALAGPEPRSESSELPEKLDAAERRAEDAAELPPPDSSPERSTRRPSSDAEIGPRVPITRPPPPLRSRLSRTIAVEQPLPRARRSGEASRERRPRGRGRVRQRVQ